VVLKWARKPAIVIPAALVVVTVVAALAALALSGSPTAARKPAPKPPAAAAPVAHAKGPLLSPFTGEPVKSLGTVLAVKIDNIVYARPQTGLTDADLIYVLPVEGGLSRFLAVFSSHIPPVIGPVRSSRQDDIELLRQFGRPAFAFSGAQPQLLPVVERARIVDLYVGRHPAGYFRSSSRIAPYNLYAHTKTLLREARSASKAHNIGFTFGAAPRGGRRIASESVSYPSASFRFTWYQPKKHWLVWIDGARGETTSGRQLAPSTVVIQYTTVSTSRFKEEGLRPPYAQTVGHGYALVLRDGRAYEARWSRPNWNVGTTFTTLSGQPMNFARGQVWIVLAGKNRASRHNESQ
jgi:Protein of unknown function (DUF3048) N-terminal domain/Protein of unknown function (DUF3048) C-terminal domain